MGKAKRMGILGPFHPHCFRLFTLIAFATISATSPSESHSRGDDDGASRWQVPTSTSFLETQARIVVSENQQTKRPIVWPSTIASDLTFCIVDPERQLQVSGNFLTESDLTETALPLFTQWEAIADVAARQWSQTSKLSFRRIPSHRCCHSSRNQQSDQDLGSNKANQDQQKHQQQPQEDDDECETPWFTIQPFPTSYRRPRGMLGLARVQNLLGRWLNGEFGAPKFGDDEVDYGKSRSSSRRMRAKKIVFHSEFRMTQHQIEREATVYLDPMLPPYRLHHVALHELGHVVGLEHEFELSNARCSTATSGGGSSENDGGSRITSNVDHSFKRLRPFDSKSIMGYSHCGGDVLQPATISTAVEEGMSILYGPGRAYFQLRENITEPTTPPQLTGRGVSTSVSLDVVSHTSMLAELELDIKSMHAPNKDGGGVKRKGAAGEATGAGGGDDPANQSLLRRIAAEFVTHQLTDDRVCDAWGLSREVNSRGELSRREMNILFGSLSGLPHPVMEKISQNLLSNFCGCRECRCGVVVSSLGWRAEQMNNNQFVHSATGEVGLRLWYCQGQDGGWEVSRISVGSGAVESPFYMDGLGHFRSPVLANGNPEGFLSVIERQLGVHVESHRATDGGVANRGSGDSGGTESDSQQQGGATHNGKGIGVGGDEYGSGKLYRLSFTLTVDPAVAEKISLIPRVHNIEFSKVKSRMSSGLSAAGREHSLVMQNLRMGEDLMLRQLELGVDVTQRDQIRVLDVDGNQLKSIPDRTFKLFPSLQRIEASDNVLDGSLDVCTFLRHGVSLNAEYNSITTLTCTDPRKRVGSDNNNDLHAGNVRINLAHNRLGDLEGSIDALMHMTQLHELDLRGNGIESLPNLFSQKLQLVSLDVRSNRLRSLPAPLLEHSPLLQVLRIDDNLLTALPIPTNGRGASADANAASNRLEVVTATKNVLTSPSPEFFHSFPSLHTLDLSNNALGTVSIPRNSARNLKILRCSNCELRNLVFEELLHISESVINATRAVEDDQQMHSNHILSTSLLTASSTEQPSQMSSSLSLLSLEELDVSQNSLTTTVFLACSPNVSRVDIGDNDVESLDWMKGKTRLSSLKASNNRIQNLPHLDETRFPDLTLLALASNRLKEIRNEEIAAFEALQHLDLSRNELKTLPFAISQTPLRVLDVSFNQLVALPQTTGRVSIFPHLRILNVRSNQLSSFVTYRSFPLLHRLDLSHNRLSELQLWNSMKHNGWLSSNFWLEPALSYLDISHNLLSTATADYTVANLDCSHNNFTSAGDCATMSHEYAKLNLDHNHIESINIHHITHLGHLSLRSNGLRQVTSEVTINFEHRQVLEVIDLQDNNLESVEMLAPAMPYFGNLKEIRLRNSGLPPPFDRNMEAWELFSTASFQIGSSTYEITTPYLTEFIRFMNFGDGIHFRCPLLLDLPKTKNPNNMWNGLKMVNLMAPVLRRVPQWLLQLPRLRHLVLTEGQYTHFPNGEITSPLVAVDITATNVETLPHDIVNVQSLQKLRVAMSPLKALPKGFENMSNLRKLFLQETELPEKEFDAVFKLASANLQVLNITPKLSQNLWKRARSESSSNWPSELSPPQIPHSPLQPQPTPGQFSFSERMELNFPNMLYLRTPLLFATRRLSICAPQLVVLSLRLSKIHHIELTCPQERPLAVHLDKCGLETFSYKSLQPGSTVDLSHNNLKELPAPSPNACWSLSDNPISSVDISHVCLFPHLHERLAKLEGTLLTNITSEVCGGNNGNPREFLLARNRLIEIPKSLIQCESLRIVDFTSNFISHIPEWLQQSNLRSLTLDHNPIDYESFTLSLVLPATLRELNLKNTTMTSSIVASLPALKRLQHLDLSDNNIQTLQDSFLKKLPNLKSLFLQNNKLARLPESSTVTKIRMLDVQRNVIAHAPRWVYSVEHVVFKSNKLTTMQPRMLNFGSLSDNPFDLTRPETPLLVDVFRRCEKVGRVDACKLDATSLALEYPNVQLLNLVITSPFVLVGRVKLTSQSNSNSSSNSSSSSSGGGSPPVYLEIGSSGSRVWMVVVPASHVAIGQQDDWRPESDYWSWWESQSSSKAASRKVADPSAFLKVTNVSLYRQNVTVGSVVCDEYLLRREDSRMQPVIAAFPKATQLDGLSRKERLNAILKDEKQLHPLRLRADSIEIEVLYFRTELIDRVYRAEARTVPMYGRGWMRKLQRYWASEKKAAEK